MWVRTDNPPPQPAMPTELHGREHYQQSAWISRLRYTQAQPEHCTPAVFLLATHPHNDARSGRRHSTDVAAACGQEEELSLTHHLHSLQHPSAPCMLFSHLLAGSVPPAPSGFLQPACTLVCSYCLALPRKIGCEAVCRHQVRLKCRGRRALLVLLLLMSCLGLHVLQHPVPAQRSPQQVHLLAQALHRVLQ